MAETIISASVALNINDALAKVAELENALKKAMTFNDTGLAKSIGSIKLDPVLVDLKPKSTLLNQEIKKLKPGKVSVQFKPDSKALNEAIKGLKPRSKVGIQFKPDSKTLNDAIAGLKLKPVTVPVKLAIDDATLQSFREGLVTTLMKELSVKQIGAMTGQTEQMTRQLMAAAKAGSNIGKGISQSVKQGKSSIGGLTQEAENLQKQLLRMMSTSSMRAGTASKGLSGDNLNVYSKYYHAAEQAVARLDTDSSAEAQLAAKRAVEDLRNLQNELGKLTAKGKQLKPFDTLMQELEQLRSLGGVPQNIARSLDKLYSDMNASQHTEFDAARMQNEMDKALTRIQGHADSVVKAAKNSLSSLSQDLTDGVFGNQTDAAKAEIENLRTALSNFDIAQPDLTGIDNAIAKLRDLKAAQVEARETSNLGMSRAALTAGIDAQFQKSSNAARLFGDRLREIKAQIADADKTKLAGLEAEFRTVTKQADALSRAGKTLGDVLKSAFSSLSPTMLAGSAAQYITRNITQSVQTLKGVDTYLTEISKVSDRSASSIEALGEAAFDAASEYGAQVETYLKGVQEWSRAGYDAQSDALGKVTVLAQAAGDMTSEMATSYLVATNAAYKLQGNAAKLTSVLDGQNQITNRNAVSMEELAAATQVAGAQAATAGIEIDKFSAAVGTIQAVTQQGGNVAGRAFKAILMNLQQVTGTTEDGDVIDEKQLNKVERALISVGVATTEMRDGMLRLRDPMQILEELSNVFKDLDSRDIRKANVISALGGKMRGSQLSALLDNWETYQKMLADFNDNAAGSAAREAEKTAQSWEGAANRVQNSFAKAVSGVIDTKTITGALNLLSRMVDVVGSLASATLNLNPANIVTIFTTFKLLQASWKSENGSLLGGLVSAFKEVGAAGSDAFKAAKDSANEATGSPIKRAIAGVRSLGSAFKASANAANEAGQMSGKLMSALATVGNMAVSILAGMAISAIVDAISDKIHEAERIAEEADEAISKYEAAKSENASKRESIAGIKDEFTELLKGVDQNGRNISLTNDEYARYVELSGQIVEVLPELTTGYAKNGDALVGVTGQAESFNEVLEQQLSLKQQLAEQEYLDEYDTVRANAINKYAEQADGLPGTNYVPELGKDFQFIDKYRAVWSAVTELVNTPIRDLEEYNKDFDLFVSDISQRVPAALRESLSQADIKRLLGEYMIPLSDTLADINFEAIGRDGVTNVHAANAAFATMLDSIQSVREAIAITVRNDWDYASLGDDVKALAEGMALRADTATIFADDFNRIDFAQGLIDDLQALQSAMPRAAESITTLNSRLDNGDISLGRYRNELVDIVQTARRINPEFGEQILAYINPTLDFDTLNGGMEAIREKVIDDGNLGNYLYSLTMDEYEIALKIVTNYDGEELTASELRKRISDELSESTATYQFKPSAYTADVLGADKKRQTLTDIYSKYLSGDIIASDAYKLVDEYPEFEGIFDFIKDGRGTEGLSGYLTDQIKELYAGIVTELDSVITGMSADNETLPAAKAFREGIVSLMTLDPDELAPIAESAQRYSEYMDLYAQAVNEARYGFEKDGRWQTGASPELIDSVRNMFGELGKDTSLAISQDELGRTIVNPDAILTALREGMTSAANAAKASGAWGFWQSITQGMTDANVTEKANEFYDAYIERISAIKDALNSLLSGEALDAQTLSELDARFGSTLSDVYADGAGAQAVAAALTELLSSESTSFIGMLDTLRTGLANMGADTGP